MCNIRVFQSDDLCPIMKFISNCKYRSRVTRIVIMALLLAGTPAMAQDKTDSREKVSLGVKAGLNRSNVWDGSGQDFVADPKFGFAGGVFAGIPFTKYLGIQPELLISQKGFRGAGMLLGYPYSFTRTTTYFDIPLQFQLKPAEFLTIVLGPQYSYLLSRRDVYQFGANSNAQQEEFNNDNIRKNTLGFVAGADIITSNVVISGRVGWDLMTNNGDGTSTTPRYKNQWVQFTVGLKI
jgi:hypothetical protein